MVSVPFHIILNDKPVVLALNIRNHSFSTRKLGDKIITQFFCCVSPAISLRCSSTKDLLVKKLYEKRKS